jgi:hypothetical protein
MLEEEDGKVVGVESGLGLDSSSAGLHGWWGADTLLLDIKTIFYLLQT